MNDETAVMRTISTMTDAFEAGDIDAVMRCYETPATIVFEPGQPVTERSQQIAAFRELAQLRPRFSYSGHEVFIAGDNAVHIAPWTMTAKSPDGQDITQQGLSVATLRRQADNSWRMVVDNPHGARLVV